jgi:hypothetical protein
MRGMPLTILLLLANAAFPAGQSAAPQGGSPTLAETGQWLESHLVGTSHGVRKTVINYRSKKGKDPKEIDRQATDTHETVSSVRIDRCSMAIEQVAKGDDYTVITVSTVPLDRLIDAIVKTDKYDPVKTQNGEDSSETNTVPTTVTVLVLEASSGVIPYRRKSTGNVPLEWNSVPYEGKAPTLNINSDDQEMPARLAKAFNHAIQLCRVSENAKPEPF